MTWLSVGPAASSRSGTASLSSSSQSNLSLSAFSSCLSKSRTFRHETWRRVQILQRPTKYTLNLIWKISGRFPVETCGCPSSFFTTYESSKKVPAFLARSAAVVLVCRFCGKSITHNLSLDNPTKLPPGKRTKVLPRILIFWSSHTLTSLSSSPQNSGNKTPGVNASCAYQNSGL